MQPKGSGAVEKQTPNIWLWREGTLHGNQMALQHLLSGN